MGVMHLAGEVFDVVMHPNNRHQLIRPEMPGDHQLGYWRRVVRLAALCHDIGHLPFSHAAEHDLLPPGWNHERLTFDLINSREMRDIFQTSVPPVNPDHVAKIAIGPKKLSEFAPDVTFTVWETLLSEIIVGDAFGVDRIDYLLRDAYHAGVVYGRFDHHRLGEFAVQLESRCNYAAATAVEYRLDTSPFSSRNPSSLRNWVAFSRDEVFSKRSFSIAALNSRSSCSLMISSYRGSRFGSVRRTYNR